MEKVVEATEDLRPSGLGGWMILPALNVLLLPLIVLGNYAQVSDSVPEAQRAGIANFYMASFAVFVAQIVLMFRHHPWFPTWYIVTTWAMVMLNLPRLGAGVSVPKLVWLALGAILWTVYMLRSRRVENTFRRASRDDRPAMNGQQ